MAVILNIRTRRVLVVQRCYFREERLVRDELENKMNRNIRSLRNPSPVTG